MSSRVIHLPQIFTNNTQKFVEKMSSDDEICKMDIHTTMSREKLRKLTKPLMEKRRRARINSCLNQLKNLVLEAMNQNTSHFSKLEKADILEMTVKHLTQLQRRQAESQKQLDGCGLARFRAGYAECAQEVARCLATVNQGDAGLRVMEHLAQRIPLSPESKLTPTVRPNLPTHSPVLQQHAPALYVPLIPPSGAPAQHQACTDYNKLSYLEYLQSSVDNENKNRSPDCKTSIRSPQKSRKSTTPTRFPISDVCRRETPTVYHQSDIKMDRETQGVKSGQAEPMWRPW